MMFVDKGTVIDGKFTLLGTIGHGGMGVVYEAYQLGLDRVVALKLLASVPEDSQDEVVRFEREALILSKLSHANIVQFYAYGTWSGFPYIAMERLVGDNLHKLLAKNEPLPLTNTIEYVSQICDGLEHAHAHGIFHRDIKPTNIVLSTAPGGRMTLKIIDFGLAKLTGNNVQKLTHTNTALGTVMYMSPEQCTGQLVDHRSDIYSLGCLLYHCLTGEPPYCADNAVAVMFQQVNEPVQNASGWGCLPGLFQDVVGRCLEKEPADRFQSCGDLRDSLIQAAQSAPVSVSVSSSMAPVSSKANSVQFFAGQSKVSREKFVLGAALTISCALVGGFLWYTAHKPGQSENMDATTSLGSPKEIVTNRILENERSLHRNTGDLHLNPKEVEQLAQAIEQLRQDPTNDANLLLDGYVLLAAQYDKMGEVDKLRSMLSVAVEGSLRATNSSGYVTLLSKYHEVCSHSGCELSLLDKLEGTRQRFPNMRFPERQRIDLLLVHDYAKLGRDAEARQLLLSALRNSQSPQIIASTKTLLKQLDDRAGAIKQIKLLSQQIDEQSRAKKATAPIVLQLVEHYRSIGKDPTELILQHLANPANSRMDESVLNFELGRTYMHKGEPKKCEQIWKDLLEPLRSEARPERRLKSFSNGGASQLTGQRRYVMVFGLARMYLKGGRYRDCIDVVDQWSKDASAPKGVFFAETLTVYKAHAYRHAGAAEIAEKLYRQVIAGLDQAVEKDKNYRLRSTWLTEARCGLACTLYLQGRYQESLLVSSQAANEATKMGQYPKAAWCGFVRAACLEKLNRVDDAAAIKQRTRIDMAHIGPGPIGQLSYIFDDVVPLSSIAMK